MTLEILPDDVLREILLFLPIEDLHSILLANRFLNQMVDSETQWRLVYLSLTSPVTPKKGDDIKAMAESLSKVSVKQNVSSSKDSSSQLKDKMFPQQTWKFNVQMTRNHMWSPFLVDVEGKKVKNPMGPIIDESGRVLRFIENDKRRIYRIANIVRPISTRGKTRIDLKVQMCLEEKSKVDTVHSFCSSWVLMGIVEENILCDLYRSRKKRNYHYMGEFLQGENIGYANNGFFSRKQKNNWTDKFCSGDVITFVVDAEHEYEEAKESNWEKPYGLLTCLLNGVEADTRSYSGIFANPDARLYFCTQVNEDYNHSVCIENSNTCSWNTVCIDGEWNHLKN